MKVGVRTGQKSAFGSRTGKSCIAYYKRIAQRCMNVCHDVDPTVSDFILTLRALTT